MSPTARLGLLAGAALLVTTTAACHPRKLGDLHVGSGGVHVSTLEPMDTAVTVNAKLDCPSDVGALKRTAIAADGGSCDYASEKGAVHLSMVDAQTDPKAALAQLRGQLDAELPGVAEHATIQVMTEKNAGGAEHTKVDMPFIHVEDDGDHSRVRLLGINIESHSHSKRIARYRHDGASDGDGDDDAEVSTGNTVASTTPPEKRGVELVYVLVSGKPSTAGYHVMGYVAKGPPQGKLVVATFRYIKGQKTWSDGERHDDDVDQLMRLNVKPA